MALGAATNGLAYTNRPDPVDPNDNGACTSRLRSLPTSGSGPIPGSLGASDGRPGSRSRSRLSCSLNCCNASSNFLTRSSSSLSSALAGTTSKAQIIRAPKVDHLLIVLLREVAYV